jgi:hypothetical protein
MKYLNRASNTLIMLYYNITVSRLRVKYSKVLEQEISRLDTSISSVENMSPVCITRREKILSFMKRAQKVLTIGHSWVHVNADLYLPELERFLDFMFKKRARIPEMDGFEEQQVKRSKN